MHRWRRARNGVAASTFAVAICACSGGGGKSAPTTTASGPGGPPTVAALATTTTAAGPPTTASAYKTAGEKHTLPDGSTVAVSYAKSGLAMPKTVTPPPSGQVYSFFTLKVCAPKDKPVVVEPAKYKVEVPGQGFVSWVASTPELRKPGIPAEATVAAGTCLSGNLHYLIGGELHIEAITYEAPDGLYRWAS